MTGKTEWMLASLGGVLALTVSVCPPVRSPVLPADRPAPRARAAPAATPTPGAYQRAQRIEDPLKRLDRKLRAIERKLEAHGK